MFVCVDKKSEEKKNRKKMKGGRFKRNDWRWRRETRHTTQNEWKQCDEYTAALAANVYLWCLFWFLLARRRRHLHPSWYCLLFTFLRFVLLGVFFLRFFLLATVNKCTHTDFFSFLAPHFSKCFKCTTWTCEEKTTFGNLLFGYGRENFACEREIYFFLQFFMWLVW